MDLSWLDPGDLGRADVDGIAAVYETTRAADFPHALPRTVAAVTADLRHGWDGETPVVAMHRDARGRVVGVVEVWLPEYDNRHMAYLEITVDPAARRQGIGRTLYEAGVERARAAGRTLAVVEAFDTVASGLFAKSMGLDRAIESVNRRQQVWRLDWSRLDEEHAAAERAATSYELVRMPGRIPEQDMAATVELVAAINDAPLDDLALEDEVFSPERLRAHEASQEAHHRRLYRLVARHRESGVLAGHTVVAVEAEQPWFAQQFDTSVLRAHRGHRLGLLLKIGMLRWLAEADPGVRVVDTWNAASNEHMIAVNEILGYEVVATATGYQQSI
jgi:GNAT superfamily N-acetyltransferase